MTKTNPKRNKGRGADDERDHGHRLGGRRHLANTGGPEDVEHPQFAIQVKGGKSVTTAIFRSGMDDAEEASLRSGKPPLLAITDRSGDRLRRYVAMPEEVFADLYLRCYICGEVPVQHPRRWEDIEDVFVKEPMGHPWTRDLAHHEALLDEWYERRAEAQRRLDKEAADEVD